MYVIVEEDEEADNSHKAGEIIKVEPEVGKKLTAGDTIRLYIPNLSSSYPDFTKGDYSLKDIEAWCEKYNVTLLQVYNPTNDYPAGTIYEQSQKAGTNVIANQTLKIYIAEEALDDNAPNGGIDEGNAGEDNGDID